MTTPVCTATPIARLPLFRCEIDQAPADWRVTFQRPVGRGPVPYCSRCALRIGALTPDQAASIGVLIAEVA